jgi:prophage regulatory protein
MNSPINQDTSLSNCGKITGRIIPKSEVINLTGLSKSTIYSYIQQGRFPAPIKLGVRRVGWLELEVMGWIGNAVIQSRSSSGVNVTGGGKRPF